MNLKELLEQNPNLGKRQAVTTVAIARCEEDERITTQKLMIPVFEQDLSADEVNTVVRRTINTIMSKLNECGILADTWTDVSKENDYGYLWDNILVERVTEDEREQCSICKQHTDKEKLIETGYGSSICNDCI